MAVSVIGVTSFLKPEGAKHGAVFGVMEQTLWLIRVSRYNVDRKHVSCHLSVILLTALVQCRGTDRQRSQEFVIVQNLYCKHWSGVRVVRHEGHDIESRKFKNRDKQMTFIVRVSTIGVNCGIISFYHWSRIPFLLLLSRNFDFETICLLLSWYPELVMVKRIA